MLRSLFKPRPARAQGSALYACAVAQARRPEFYRDLGVEDRIDARFELYTLHVILLVQRLADDGAEAVEASQALFDTFVSALDHALRELGVGDLSVAKKMRPLGEAIYGRTRAYQALMQGEPDRPGIESLMARTLFGDETRTEQAAPLADYAIRTRSALAGQPLAEILAGQPAWPAPIAQGVAA